MDDFASQVRLLIALIDYERCVAPTVEEAVRRALMHCASIDGRLFNALTRAGASDSGAAPSQLLQLAGEECRYIPLILVGVTCDLFNRIENRNVSVGQAAEAVLNAS